MTTTSPALSKLSVAAANCDFEVKKLLRSLIQVDTVAGAGTVIGDAAQLTAGRNAVTVADGTVGVRLPTALLDASVEVINTVSNQTMKVWPFAAAEQINAITAGSAFSLVGGARAMFVCDAIGHWYVAAANLTGTSTSSSTAELDTLHNVTAGTVAVSKAAVVDANKSVDVLQATTSLSVGGTGVPGAAAVEQIITKAVTAFADTTAKTVFTVTIPNAGHAAMIEVDSLGVLGAGGTVGTGDASMSTKYLVNIQRTTGANAVAGVSAIVSSAKSKTAGGDDITSVVVTTAAVVGAVGASNTIPIQVAITKAAGASANHTGTFSAKVLNANATGITIA
jgi:hypothetical protein